MGVTWTYRIQNRIPLHKKGKEKEFIKSNQDNEPSKQSSSLMFPKATCNFNMFNRETACIPKKMQKQLNRSKISICFTNSSAKE